MENILTFDEYNVDLTTSEGLFTIDLIYLLMEEEHRLGLDVIDEGFSNAGGVSRFTPGKNDSKLNNTKIFANGTKEFKYYVQPLPKSGIDSINLYKLGQISIQKLLKHPEEYKAGKYTKEKFDIDEESIERFMKRSALYIRSIIRKLDFDVDIITCPPSSSGFNEKLIKYVMSGYSEGSIKCIPNLFLKDIRTVVVNRQRAKDLGMTDEEIDKLEDTIESWKKQYQDIFPMRILLDQLCDELMTYRSNLPVRKGRKPHDYNVLTKKIMKMREDIRQKKAELDIGNKEKFVQYVENEELADILRKLGDKDYKYKKDVRTVPRSRDFEIKSLDDKTRKAIENLFTLNDDLSKYKTSSGEVIWGIPIEDRIKDKNIVLFDDNISSGATLDDMCLTLLKHGAKSVLPITLAIIPESQKFGEHDLKPFLNRKGINESNTLQIDLDKETVTDAELFDNGDANYYFTTDEPLPDNTATMEAFLEMVDNTDESIEWEYDGSQTFGKMRNGRTIQIDAGGDGDFTHHLVSVTIVK